MDQLTRRRRTQAAIAELMETVYDTLLEAVEDNPNGIPATDVAAKAFIPLDGPHIPFTQYILRQLAELGLAENDTSIGPNHWRPSTPK